MPRQVFLIKFLVFLLFLLLQLRPFSRPRGGLVPGLELPFLEILLVLEIFLIPVKLSLLLQIFLCEGIDFVPPCEPSLILSGAGLVSGLCPWRYACLLAWTAGSEFLRSFLAHLLARPRLSCQPSFKPESPGSWHDEPVFVDPCPGFVSSHSCHGLFPGHLCHGLVPCSYWSPQTCFCGPFLFTCTQVF